MTDTFDEIEEAMQAISTPVPKSIQVVDATPGAGLKARVVVDQEGRTRRVRKDGEVSKPLGRPPGSRNRPKDGQEPDRAGASPTRIVTPPRREPQAKDAVDQDAAKKAERDRKVSEYEQKLTGEISEDLLAAVMAATGIPSEVFFVSGKAPVRFTPNTNLTRIGQAFAIPNDVAHYWSKVLVAFTETDSGKKLTGSFEGGNAGLLFAGLMAVASTVRYFQQVKSGMQMLSELAEQMAQQQTRMEAANAPSG